MGQAKQRGTFEERRAAAIKRDGYDRAVIERERERERNAAPGIRNLVVLYNQFTKMFAHIPRLPR